MGDDGAVLAGPPDGADGPEPAATSGAEPADTGERADDDEAKVAVEQDTANAAVPGDSGVPADETPKFSTRTLSLVGGLVAVLVLGSLAGWLGYHSHQSRQADQRRATFLQVGRQAAVNLTTIDVEHVEEDVKRIVDASTGQFYDDFQQRSAPFIEVVKQVKSKSVGTVTEAGLQIPADEPPSAVPDSAEVLVAVTVNTSVANQPEQGPRAWRMRIQVQQDDDGQAKVSKVDFVP